MRINICLHFKLLDINSAKEQSSSVMISSCTMMTDRVTVWDLVCLLLVRALLLRAIIGNTIFFSHKFDYAQLKRATM